MRRTLQAVCKALALVLACGVSAVADGGAGHATIDLGRYRLAWKKASPNLRELSGLTWSGATETLFAVNDLGRVCEIDEKGNLLRTISLPGWSDPEGIAWERGPFFWIAEEDRGTLTRVEIDRTVTALRYDKTAAWRFLLEATGLGGNTGLEGLAYDRDHDRLWAVQERTPKAVYVVPAPRQPGHGTTRLKPKHPWDLEKKPRVLLGRDVSGILRDDVTDHLLLVSHEAGAVVEVDRDGTEVSHLLLDDIEKGWFGKVEGVAIDEARRLWLVGERAGGSSEAWIACFVPKP